MAPGQSEPSLTVFLAGAECPFACVFCDLWRYTLGGPTPPGAIPAQLRKAFATLDGEVPRDRLRAKLYNASNFFEPRAVPEVDDAEILGLLEPFPAVTVENHPRLTNARCLEFGAALAGRLEVAMGLETVRPETLDRLNKGTTVDDFDRAAERLTAADIDLRAFVLVGPPHQPVAETVEWAVRSARHAFDRGARFVALNPVRGGNGYMDRLRERGDWRPPSLRMLEQALARVLSSGEGLAVADLWEIEDFGSCDSCDALRVDNLRAMNTSQRPREPVSCAACA